MRARLTKIGVEGIQPGATDIVVWDTEVNGFGLKITPSGKRTYFLFYRTSSGQQRKPTIGAHGTITADQARQTAKQWMARVTLGEDVSRARVLARQGDTFSELADRHLTDYAIPHKKPRSVAGDKSLLENHLLPLLGRSKVKELTRPDVERIKLAIRNGQTARRLVAKVRGRRVVRGGEGVANRALALLSKMFACAEDWGLREGNPARGIRKYRERRNDRFLSNDEVGRLLTVLDQADAAGSELPQTTAALRLLLFTGMRYSEVMMLTWGSVDATTRCFRLADTKTGARVIPLSDVAFAVIASLGRGRQEEFVFAGRDGGVPIALRRCWYRLREQAGIDTTVNLHCLRHTFASWSVMGGLSLAQVGALLGHRSAQTTLRYADHAVDALRAYSGQTATKLAAMQSTIAR